MVSHKRSWVQILARYSGWPGHYNNVGCSARLEISFELKLLPRVYKVTLIYFTLEGSHPTWKTWNSVILFSRPGKCMEFAQKEVKTWNFNSKPGKNTLKCVNSIFQASLFKMSFTKIILIDFFVIFTLSTQTLI